MANTKKPETQELTLTKFNEFDSVQEAEKFCAALIGTPAVPSSFEDPKELLSVLTMGKELGFKPLISLNNISIVKGKTVYSVHMLAALLKQQGFEYQLMKDFEPETDAKGDPILDTDGNPKMCTIIRFYWHSNVTKTVLQHDHKFTWAEAGRMGLHDKDNYKKMPRIMMRARCLAMGARFVNPKGMMGLYTDEEMIESIKPGQGEEYKTEVKEDGTIEYQEIVN
jgi:hypothetical protein